MEIIIGAPAPVGPPVRKTERSTGTTVEARILNVRPPRRQQTNRPEEKNRRKGYNSSSDPINGRVMVLLIPEGHKLPQDIDSGKYRIFLRFAPHKG